jgi:hypothetical protein
MKLSESEIKGRMIELTNLRKLHTSARTRVIVLEEENSF